MDSKGEESKMSYPNIFFMIDNFEEVGQPPLVALDSPLLIHTLGCAEHGSFFSATCAGVQ